MLHSLEVKDYMDPKPVTVFAHTDVLEAINLMMTHKISGVCVVDEQNNLVGVLSELDCLEAVIASTYYENAAVGKVESFMTTQVDTVAPTAPVLDVAKSMYEKNQRRRPVIAEGKLVGQLSCRNIMQAVGKFTQRKAV